MPDPTSPGRVAKLTFGEPYDLGPFVEAHIDGKPGTIPSRWKVRAEVEGHEGHYAVIYYKWHFPSTATADRMELNSPKSHGVSPSYFSELDIAEHGFESAKTLARLIDLTDEIPGGVPSAVVRRMKELELIKAAIYYSMSSNRGYQVVAEQMNMPRQTAAMRISEARKQGYLPPLETPHQELWSYVTGKYEQWKKENGVEQ